MLTLDQVRLLENRVQKAVSKIEFLTAENTRLAVQLSESRNRVAELENAVRSFKDDQGRIEEGIVNALNRLSAYEDSVYNAPRHAEAPDVGSFTDAPAGEVSPAGEDSPAVEPEPLIQPAPGAETGYSFDLPASGPAQVEVEAEWQNTAESADASVASEDGQMDIF